MSRGSTTPGRRWGSSAATARARRRFCGSRSAGRSPTPENSSGRTRSRSRPSISPWRRICSESVGARCDAAMSGTQAYTASATSQTRVPGPARSQSSMTSSCPARSTAFHGDQSLWQITSWHLPSSTQHSHGLSCGGIPLQGQLDATISARVGQPAVLRPVGCELQDASLSRLKAMSPPQRPEGLRRAVGRSGPARNRRRDGCARQP